MLNEQILKKEKDTRVTVKPIVRKKVPLLKYNIIFGTAGTE